MTEATQGKVLKVLSVSPSRHRQFDLFKIGSSRMSAVSKLSQVIFHSI